MKANELRIGNYCLVNDIVTKVSPSIITDVWESERIWLKPIPITEEWLNKLPEDLISEMIPSWVKYIHQLQNWYWIENSCEKELIFEK